MRKDSKDKNRGGIIVPLGKKEVVSEGKFLRFVTHEYIDRYGTQKRWEAVERIQSGNIVLLFPVTTDRQVILVKQFRFPIGMEVIELPAGVVDRTGESVEETAMRELREETGYAAGSVTLLLQGMFDSGTIGDRANVFYAADCVRIGEPQPEASEQIEVLTVPLDRIIDFVTNPLGHIPIDIKIPAIYAILKERGLI